MSSTDEFPHDEEQKTGSEEGKWIASEPPVDDFGDSPTEEATVSEDTEQPHEEAAPAAADKKRKSSVVLLIAAVGGLAALGGVAYWQFGTKEQPSLLDMQAQKAPLPPLTSAPATPSAPSAPVAPTTAFGSPAPAEAPPPEHPSMPQTSATTPSTVVEAPAVPPSAALQAPPPAPGNGTTEIAPAPSSGGATADVRLTALSSRIDDLQKSMAQASQQLGQISEKLTQNQTQPSAPASAQPDAAMVERLDKLEQKLLQIEERQESLSAQPTPARKAARPPVEKPAHVAKHHATPPSPKTERAVAKAKAPQGWVLRAATPDEAWVAKDAETRELHPVHVGDELPGVGKITSIQQDSGSWVVRGTAGTVR